MGNSCSRGRANPNQGTKYRLWADAAGYCHNPACRSPLFVEVSEVYSVHFGEMAHVIAASGNGPRGNDEAEAELLGAWDNLILLCANCHTLIDKAPTHFPTELILTWKAERLADVERVLGIANFESRTDVRSAIEPYLIQNEYIHRTIGPDNDYQFDPEAEEASMWRHEVIATIIPNHHRILRIVESNRALLTRPEKVVVAEYQSHVGGLVNRHQGKGGLRTVRYPREVNELYADS